MGVHRFAVATALATFLLLVAGGLVSSTESGLACPDWPLCEGQYFPKMAGGKFFEHGHRLVAATVAVLNISLCFLLLKYRRRDKTLVGLGIFAAVLVVVQALLGALTVKLRLPPWVSSLHQATAMAFFCLVTSLAFLTRQRLSSSVRDPGQFRRRMGWMTLAVTSVTYLQIVAGAVMRHVRAGLACGYDFPLCQGHIWPLGMHWGVQLHMLHRVGGVLVGIAVVTLSLWIWRQPFQVRGLRFLSAAAAVMVLIQISLGAAVIFTSRELVTMTFHSSLGAALLATLVSLYWVSNPSRVDSTLSLQSHRAAAG
jgi:cytochrome c oxidase assembly protein subunit 15